MNEPFDIPVIYNGRALSFPARLLQQGYTHRFAVDVYGNEILFEPDEERNYRAMTEDAHVEPHTAVDVELLKAIAGAIEEIVK